MPCDYFILWSDTGCRKVESGAISVIQVSERGNGLSTRSGIYISYNIYSRVQTVFHDKFGQTIGEYLTFDFLILNC